MIYLLDTCNNIAFKSVVPIVKGLVNLIQIIGPILSIVSLTYLLIQKVKNPDEKN